MFPAAWPHKSLKNISTAEGDCLPPFLFEIYSIDAFLKKNWVFYEMFIKNKICFS